MTKRPSQQRTGRADAFTLLEVLVALGLLAIGIAAVAAIFPAGLVLQQQTQDKVLSQQTAGAAKATVRASKTDSVVVLDNTAATQQDGRLQKVKNLATHWPLSLRSYPKHVTPTAARRYFWVPLVRDRNDDAGQIEPLFYICVLKRKNTGTYSNATYGNGGDTSIPGLRKITLDGTTQEVQSDQGNYHDTFLLPPSANTSHFQPGTKVIDGQGRTFTVVRVNKNANGGDGSLTVDGRVTGADEIWYAPPPDNGGDSAMQRITAVSGS